jgi:hypothetical protein
VFWLEEYSVQTIFRILTSFVNCVVLNMDFFSYSVLVGRIFRSDDLQYMALSLRTKKAKTKQMFQLFVLWTKKDIATQGRVVSTGVCSY